MIERLKDSPHRRLPTSASEQLLALPPFEERERILVQLRISVFPYPKAKTNLSTNLGGRLSRLYLISSSPPALTNGLILGFTPSPTRRLSFPPHGRIAEESLNYLRSRGLTEDEAIDLIVAGFLGEKEPAIANK